MKKILISIMLSCMLITGCSQIGAKKYGGSYTHELPKGEKLVNVTWKDDTLWYLTEPMNEDYEPITYKFKADSVYGVFEGTVTVVESK